MARLVYSALASLDGFVADRDELVDERRFGNGVVHLHYRTRT